MESYAGDLDGPWSYYNANKGVTSYFTNGARRRGSFSQVSVKTPGWFNLSRKQKKAALWNPYSHYLCRSNITGWTDVNYTVGSGNVKRRWVASGYGIGGVSFGTGNGNATAIPVSIVAPLIADSKRKALAGLQKNIADHSVNLAQAFAERKQTVNLFTTQMQRLVSFALLLRRGKFTELHKKYGIPKPIQTRSGAWVVPRYRKETRTYSMAFDERGNPLSRPKKVRAVGYREVHTKRWIRFDNLWLEYSYGWRPLIGDIYGSAEAIANAYYKSQPVKFIGRNESEQHLLRPGPTRSAGGAASFPTQLEINASVTSRYVLECIEENLATRTLAQLGITNPALLAWELLPYSFVVDWFVPIGSFLQQLEYARGMSFQRGSVTVVTNLDCLFHNLGKNVAATSSSYPWAGETWGAPYSIKVRDKKREILSSFPYQKLPSLNPKLGVERSLSAIALVTTLIRGDKTSAKTMRHM